MKGNLTIDSGNTSVKVAFYIGEQRVATNRFVWSDKRLLERMISSYKPDTATICSTAPANDDQLMSLVSERCRRVLYLSHETPLPITLGYRTPASLGRDRIATAVGGWTLCQRLDTASDVLIIDAGTAITYDLVTAKGCFVGGNIAPGMTLRFQALHEHTGLLPLVDMPGDLPMLGYDTETAIRSGVVLGLLGEIRSYIADLRLSHPLMHMILTGGNGKMLHELLHDDNIIYYEHLSLEGLNRIFLHNTFNDNE